MNSLELLNYWEYVSMNVYEWLLAFAVLFLALELLNDLLTRRASGERFLETLSSLFTQVPYYFAEAIVFAGAVSLYFVVYEYIPWKIPVNGLTVVLTLLAADFIYYVQHYCLHKVRLLWLAHSVHHSSQMMNTATAFRFSIFDPLVSVLFHFPLVLMGFNPILIVVGEILVLAYQFWIHNEIIGRLGPLEWVFNTPSHHRVHHGSDSKYLDRNYGGVLIIWDRLFGTFQKEEETPTYGLTTPMTSKNPVTVQFYEFPKLVRDLKQATSAGEASGYLFKAPGWQPTRGRDGSE